MHDMSRMCDVVGMEIEKIADKGLTASNIETAYKLVDIYKDIKTIEAMEGDDYSRASYSRETHGNGYSQDYDRGNSYGRYGEHYVKGHYSRAGADMSDKLEDIMRDASPEDRKVLERFAGRLSNL